MVSIFIFHAFGQSTFESDEILAYGSLENLTASEILQGVPNREKSLTQLWEAAHIEIPEEPAEEMPQAETEETEKEG